MISHFRKLNLLALIALAACQSVAKLPDGQLTSLSPENAKVRGTLQVVKSSPKGPLRYRAISDCRFREVLHPGTPNFSDTTSVVTLKQGRGVLLGSANDSKQEMTFAISSTGKILDWNSYDKVKGQRVTKNNFAQVAGQTIAKALNSGTVTQAADPHSLNPLSFVLPEYDQPVKVDAPLAVVTIEDGSPWADYWLRGMANFQNKQVIVLDLVRFMPTMSMQPVVVGFDLVDPDTMLPSFLAFNSGLNYNLEMLSCSK